ncbi:hypothetical protein LF887_04480 [Chryseobacterium sp. MEBOG06]|uniref:hypothetical protein n=1 Tax=unclassified Chryseobacterium TaxID=2593645 RepID=UPI001F41F880|nr:MULTISPECIES: hypothetical protein [unclassified Chryseobacterium]UKB84892.1 hypothetical protein LF887_04480 [Chryseobacterium sp. MEBOG06]
MKILLEEKILGTHSKKNSKYYWVLETITGKNAETENYVDYFPSSSEKGYIHDIKDQILEKINSEHLFSFPYTPKEGDYLSIKNNLRKQEYLNLIFINNIWIEEIFICSYRNCDTDIYTTLKTGVAFLTQDI